MESEAKALSLFSDNVLLKKLFTLFREEKHIPTSQDGIGNVIMALNTSQFHRKRQLGCFQ